MQRMVVKDGRLEGYFLSTYSARKLGMKSTGNAGGSYNLALRSSDTDAEDDFEVMLRRLGTGLLVTELIGQGVNYVTGDYSRGASGFWVEGGQICYPGRGNHDRRQPAVDACRNRRRRHRHRRPRQQDQRVGAGRRNDRRRVLGVGRSVWIDLAPVGAKG